MLFLRILIFDKFSESFQTSKAATIHRLHSESERLLKKVLTFFVKPSVIRETLEDLTKIILNQDNQLSDFIGDDTAAFYLNLKKMRV